MTALRVRLGAVILVVAAGCGADDVADKRVFTTSERHAGDFGALTDADAWCTERATGAGLDGTWVAWLSDSQTDAIDRITADGPWVLLDGREVFADRAALSGQPAAALDVDEHGAAASQCVWTGTDVGGTRTAEGSFCLDWTDATNQEQSSFGNSDASDAAWTEGVPEGACQGNTGLCIGMYALYCFEQ